VPGGGKVGGSRALRAVRHASAACLRPPPAESTAGEDEEGDDSDEVIETIFEQPSVPAVDPHDIQDAEDLLESYFIQAGAWGGGERGGRGGRCPRQRWCSLEMRASNPVSGVCVPAHAVQLQSPPPPRWTTFCAACWL
jgi:hypothetical protein